MRENNRTSRMVRLVDTEAVRPLLSGVYEALFGEPLPESVQVETQVMVEALYEEKNFYPYLDHATICTEGVGLYTNDLNCAQVWVRDGFRQFTLPLYWQRVPLGDEVDFAGFVRVFGSRLEQNWGLWERAMAKAEAHKAKEAKA